MSNKYNTQFLETSYQLFQQNLEEKNLEEAQRIVDHMEENGFTKEAWQLHDELKVARAEQEKLEKEAD